MIGIILAGGLGTRLLPLTKVTNKHLLPVFKKPMIFYPIEKLVEAGIEEAVIVVGDRSAGDFIRLLGNGRDFGLKNILYTYQEGEKGIAHALGLCENSVNDDKILVILGDNLFSEKLTEQIGIFQNQIMGARILLKQVPDPQRFGVPEIKEGKIVQIVEKPLVPPSGFAVTGIYMYHRDVFEVIKGLKPSNRGEIEITDVNNFYAEKKTLSFGFLQKWWTDAGTFDSYARAWDYVRNENR
ncbi:NTP transferase domain-containing protein [candidate division WOR-3 bacterium]|nr:NTP transferase domain-containing protein [candidate division WOR-3 bacterium]